MKNILTIAFLVISVAVSSLLAQDRELIRRVETRLPMMAFGPEGPRQTETVASIEERLAHYKLPGVNIAVIDDYEVSWAKSWGKLNSIAETPASIESIYQIGSISKVVSAAIALHFVDRGLLDLDVDINTYLTSWCIPENEFIKKQAVTLRNLLSHRAGFPSTNFAHKSQPKLVQILNGEEPALNKPAIVDFVPGSKYQYSNIGYVVLQQLLQDVTGKSFEQLAQDIVFNPLGMSSATFLYPLSEYQRKNEALPHSANGETLQAVQSTPARAQGGMTSTATDLAIFAIEIMKANVGLPNVLFSQEISRQHFTPHAKLPEQEFGGLPFRIGLGIYLMDEGNDLSIMHLGSSYPGSEAILLGFPNRGQGAVIFVNGDNNTLMMLEILAALAREYNWPSGDYFKRK